MFPDTNIIGGSVSQNFDLESRLDYQVIEACRDVLDGKAEKVELTYPIRNVHRTFGTTLSYEISMYRTTR